MPAYSFKCPSCGSERDDVILKITHTKADTPVCVECDTFMEKQVVKGSGFVLKGQGWPSQAIRRGQKP